MAGGIAMSTIYGAQWKKYNYDHWQLRHACSEITYQKCNVKKLRSEDHRYVVTDHTPAFQPLAVIAHQKWVQDSVLSMRQAPTLRLNLRPKENLG